MENVIEGPLKLAFRPNAVVVVVAIPEALTSSIQNPVSDGCRVRLPRVHCFPEIRTFEPLHDDMHMVRHDTPREKAVALAIEMTPVINDELCEPRIAQQAFAITLVERDVQAL